MCLIRSAAVVAAAAGLLAASSARADLLGVSPTNPVITYNSTGVTTYDAASGAFGFSATPLAVQFSPGAPPRFIQPDGAGARTVFLDCVLDASGNLVSGVPGDDFVVIGAIDENNDGTVDYDGVLLSGEVAEVGSSDSGATDFFDFRITPTGGALLATFADADIGVTLTVEGSAFVGDFAADFGGGAKGNIGPIDPVTGACCYIDDNDNAACEVLRAGACEDLNGIFAGDGTICDDIVCGGACCLTDGTCLEVLLEEDCTVLGGNYEGDGSDCDTTDCEQTGACCLLDGSCDVTTEFDCIAVDGTYQGDGVECTPNFLGGTGRYRLMNHPDGNRADPLYGLRIDELFDVTSGNDVFTFSFDREDGAEMFLDFDGDTIRIHGTAVGGLDIGDSYDPAYTSTVLIDFTYTNIELAADDDDLKVNEPSENTGTIIWLATSDVFDLSDKADNTGCTFRFGNEDDDAGHRGLDGLSGWGWLDVAGQARGHAQDWLFKAISLCEPTVRTGACCFLDRHGNLTCRENTQDECARVCGGTYFGDGTDCSDVTCGGACCLRDGTCISTISARECTRWHHGTFNGIGTNCDDVTCTVPGACCIEHVGCQILTEDECDVAGGTFQGDGTECVDSDWDGIPDCLDPCPHDRCNRCNDQCDRDNRCGRSNCNHCGNHNRCNRDRNRNRCGNRGNRRGADRDRNHRGGRRGGWGRRGWGGRWR